MNTSTTESTDKNVNLENEINTVQTGTLNEIGDNIELLTNKDTNQKKMRKYLAAGILIVSFIIILIITGIIVGFKFDFNANNNGPKKNSQDLVVVIMEEPVECLMDKHCTNFTFNDSTISLIKQVFNEYDGDDDDLWTKDEFVTFYIESLNGADTMAAFSYLDFDNDSVWSYKEAVIYFMLISELPMVKDFMYPVLEQAVRLVYGYNTTIYKDQLFWEYAVELMFVELDDYQQGFVTKTRYFQRLAEIEFDVFAKKDQNHETITFDEFFQSRVDQKSLNTFVNTDTDKLYSDYHHLDISLNKTHTISLLSQLELQHCLYSNIDFESLRRRLGSLWDCAWDLAGCIGTGVLSAAGCLISLGFGANPLSWPYILAICGGGTAATGAACEDAYQSCT